MTRSEEYLDACLRTWNTQASVELQIVNAILGLIGELAELEGSFYMTASDIIDELGDAYYYYTILCHLWPCKRVDEQLCNTDNHIMVAYLADVGKKIAFHNNTSKKVQNRMDIALLSVEVYLETVLHSYRLSKEEVWNCNIAKLQQRHPDGFNPNY